MRRILGLALFALVWVGPCAISSGYSIYSSVGFPPIESLTPDDAPFPYGWKADDPDTEFPPLAPCSFFGRPEVQYVTRAYRDRLFPGYAQVILVISRYGSEASASEEYESARAHTFRHVDWNTGWIVPDAIPDQNLRANSHEYACTIEGEGEFTQRVCTLVARYGLYLAKATARFSPPSHFTDADLAPFFAEIDGKLASVQHLR